MSNTEKVLARADIIMPAAEARWIEWLRIPSISAQPQHAGDCRLAAQFVVDELAAMGFEASLRETAGHPAVVAHHPGPGVAPGGAKGPHLLYYGHYDVQPADPLELWNTPPFEPTRVAGPHGDRIYARGAVDDKGQVAMWLGAFRAWFEATGSMPCRITALIEGEEETGSANFKPFVKATKEELRADICIVSDTGMWDIDTPAIGTSLRGMAYMEVTLKGPSRDLHSGMYGGSALNPINALVTALGRLKDGDGRVAVPGFYDGVRDISSSKANQWAALGFSEAEFLGSIGLSEPYGEAGRSALERLWARPTCDICGIWGGYQGVGTKTVIASEASAKVSFRLVPGQDPAAVEAGFQAFMAANVPDDATLEFSTFGLSSGLEMAMDSPFMKAALAALGDEYGKPAVLAGVGGSIPVVETIMTELGMDCILMGFGLEDDQVHSPNEKFEVTCFQKGLRSHVRLLGKMGG